MYFEDAPQVTILAPVVDETLSGALSCNVSSNPTSTIALYRIVSNLEELVSGATVRDNTLQYLIQTASREDSGVYRCTAINHYGEDNIDRNLIVRCKYSHSYNNDVYFGQMFDIDIKHFSVHVY